MLELIAAPNTQRWLLFGRARPKRAGRPGRRAGEASGLGRSVGHFGCNANDNDPHGLSTTVNRYAVLRTSFQKDFVGRQLICPTFHQKPSTKTTRDAQLGCTCACQFSFSREERLAIYVRPQFLALRKLRPAAKTPPPNRVTTVTPRLQPQNPSLIFPTMRTRLTASGPRPCCFSSLMLVILRPCSARPH